MRSIRAVLIDVKQRPSKTPDRLSFLTSGQPIDFWASGVEPAHEESLPDRKFYIEAIQPLKLKRTLSFIDVTVERHLASDDSALGNIQGEL